MTIAFVNQGTAGDQIADSITPAMPASIVAGNLLILHTAYKYPATTTLNTPSGWTQLATVASGTGTGIDAGEIGQAVYYKVAAGSDAAPTFSQTGNDSSAWTVFQFSCDAGKVWDIASTTGSDTTAGTAISITGAANPGLIAGDVVLMMMACNTDLATYGTHALAATGATFGAITERSDYGWTTGQDGNRWAGECSVSTGPASAAPVFTSTATASVSNNNGIFMRLRELPLKQNNIVIGQHLARAASW